MPLEEADQQEVPLDEAGNCAEGSMEGSESPSTAGDANVRV